MVETFACRVARSHRMYCQGQRDIYQFKTGQNQDFIYIHICIYITSICNKAARDLSHIAADI